MVSELMVALSLVMGASQMPPTTISPMMPVPPGTPAPPGGPETRYCLHLDPVIGSRIPTIDCMTRDDWADLGLDIDEEWAENGAGVIA